MFNFSKQEQLVIFVIIGICFIGGIVFLIRKHTAEVKERVIIEEEQKEQNKHHSKEKRQAQEEYIIIHITGEVKKPGIYKLRKDLRVYDAINAAGGATDLANLDEINLAAFLTDGQKIYVPSILAATRPPYEKRQQVTTSPPAATASYLININTATKEELTKLPGIGEKTAQKIIEYREQHPFTKIEDIKKVKGIGEGKFQKIKELITVH